MSVSSKIKNKEISPQLQFGFKKTFQVKISALKGIKPAHMSDISLHSVSGVVLKKEIKLIISK